jgi:hypothetical protein
MKDDIMMHGLGSLSFLKSNANMLYFQD